MLPSSNVTRDRGHQHQPPPLNPVDRFALMFMYTVGAGIAYNALPRGINKPVFFMILGAGLWHAGGCSCKCLQELGRGFFRASSHGGGSYPTYNTYYVAGGGGGYGDSREYTPPSPNQAPVRKPNTGLGGGGYSGSFSTSSTNSYGGGGSSTSSYSGGGGGGFSSFSSFGGGTPANSTMAYSQQPERKKK